MNKIRHSTTQQGFHVVFTGNAAKEFPNTFLGVMRNPRFTIFCAENDMVMERRERVCHEASLANYWRFFNRREATVTNFGTESGV
jgi:hypothetical protein